MHGSENVKPQLVCVLSRRAQKVRSTRTLHLSYVTKHTHTHTHTIVFPFFSPWSFCAAKEILILSLWFICRYQWKMWKSNISRRWIWKCILLECDALSFGKGCSSVMKKEVADTSKTFVSTYQEYTASHPIHQPPYFVVSCFDSSLWLFPSLWNLTREF